MIKNMFEDLMNKNVRVAVAFHMDKESGLGAYKNSAAVPATYNGMLTGYFVNYDEHFIVLNNNLYISTKYIQTIQVLD